MPTFARSTTRALATATLALSAALATTVGVATTASAEAPVALVDEVTDLAGALSPADVDEVGAALDDLADTTRYQLFVVYVPSFDGMSPADWADETAVRSGLGRDDVLLAVAVDDRQYQVSVDEDSPLTDDQLEAVEADRIEPALRDDDWAGAATAAAAGYAAAQAGGGASALPWGTVGAVVGGLAVVVVGALVAVRLVRRRRAAQAERDELDALDGRASSMLVAVDEAVTTSAQELGFAEAELGTTVTAPFAAALDRARTGLAGAFAARQRLDDTEPETPADRRELLTQILDACTDVDAVLDAQSADVARLRDLHARAPQLLADAERGATAVDARLSTSAVVFADLVSRYSPAALSAVAPNVEDARAAVGRAREAASRGAGVLDTDRPAAVAAAQVAADALTRAAALLDAVDAAARELAGAPDRVAQACVDLDADLADVARLAPATAPAAAGAGAAAVQQAAERARAALTHARSVEATLDPLRTLGDVRSAEAALDQVLQPLRDAEAAAARAAARLPVARAELAAQIESADATISAHRAAVWSTARTRLSEARAQAQAADAWPAGDPVGRLAAVDAATALAVAAVQAARADVAEAQSMMSDRSWSGSSGGGFGGSGGLGDLLLSTWSVGGGRANGGWGGGSSRRSSSSSSWSSSSSSRSSSSSSSRSSSRSSSGSSRRGGGGRF